jgi:Fic family protein
MQDLIRMWDHANDRQREPLLVIPLTVLDFLCIRPFADGNGRTARLLTLLLLYRAGYEVGRYISLERVIEDSRDSYHEALEASSTGEGHVGPFTMSEIEEECPGVSRDMIRHVLRRLRDEGKVKVSGRGRGARWERIGT